MLAAYLPEDARVWAALSPDAALSHEAMLLRLVEHSLRIGNWQRGGDKNKPRPEMLPMPSEIIAELEAGRREDARLSNGRARHIALAQARKAQAEAELAQ